MKKNCLFILCGLFLVTIAGCGTIKGLGEDLSALGNWMAKESDRVTNHGAATPNTNK